MKLIPLFLISAVLAAASAIGAEGKAAVKSKAATPTATAKAKAPRPTNAPWWQSSRERPCDSKACRPVRFAWSPTAPGS